MGMRTVWTKQNPVVLEEMEKNGCYFARGDRIATALGEEAPFFLPAYDWLRKGAAKRLPPPAGADYPIWVSLVQDSTMLADQKSVILEIEIEASRILPIDIVIWSRILNCAYIPADEEDLARHKQLLKDYNADDIRGVTTAFFPVVKREVLNSWERLFESKGDGRVGIIWEIQRQWVKEIIS